jgi:signal transduction histidine kinase
MRLRRWIVVSIVLLLYATVSAAASEPKRVLILDSFGRDFAPWNEYATDIRAELLRQSPEPIDLYEASLATARFAGNQQEGPFVDYLRTLFAGHQLDIVITIGAPAAGFIQRYRRQLFPSTSMLYTAVEQRRVPLADLTENDTAVAIAIDFSGAIDNILRVLPKTNNIVVVIGSSPIEKYWLEQIRSAVKPFTNHVTFTWFNNLSFNEMLKRAAALPPGSAIFFGLLSVDAAGVPHEEMSALTSLHAVANAPIFSYVDAYFGRGIVGGPLISVSDVSREAANVAVRILHGAAPNSIKTPAIGFGETRFDWRELQRWDISEARLPAGSVVDFRVPTPFEQYKWYIIAAALLCVVQAIFIAVLLLNRRRLERERVERQRAEDTAHEFSRRLISAQEDERSRLARELHDDVTQRLALLAINAGRAARKVGNGKTDETMSAMREGLTKLSEDVHALSYRLHPSILDDLGLIEALKNEAERFSRSETVPVDLKVEKNFVAPTGPIALGLFRIAQEALQNVGRHARAGQVMMSLRQFDNGFEFCVRDDGIGFEPKVHRMRPSLGLASMQQRIYLLGGELSVESSPGHGTMVLAWVPLKEEQRDPSARAAS